MANLVFRRKTKKLLGFMKNFVNPDKSFYFTVFPPSAFGRWLQNGSRGVWRYG